jgi:hypothetical protein
VAQSGLHLHQCEPHSCKENEKNSCQELRNAGGFTISLRSPPLHLIKCIMGLATDIIKSADFRKEKSVFRIFMIKTGI